MSRDLSTLQSVILVDINGILSAKPAANTLVVDVLPGDSIITIRQIRQTIAWLSQHGYEQGAKRAIILQAERWHHTAPEALLKSLEEPPPRTSIILTTNHSTSLPATIRSRCATLHLNEVPDSQLAAWGLTKGEASAVDIPMSWSEFSHLPMVQKWNQIEPEFKKWDWPGILSAWEAELLQALSRTEKRSQKLVKQLSTVHQGVADLRANVLPRLVIDKLIIDLERIEPQKHANN